MASFRLQLEKTDTKRGMGRARTVRPGLLTGLVGKEEMMLFIDSRRSGYISARRTSRSRHSSAPEARGTVDMLGSEARDNHHRTSRLEVCRAIEAQDGRRRLQPCLFTLPSRCHGQMSSRRPPYHHDPVHIDRNPIAFQGSLKSSLQPCVPVAYVCDRAFKEIDLWTEPIVDADGQNVVRKEEGGLEGSNGFLGERHVSATMNHQS